MMNDRKAKGPGTMPAELNEEDVVTDLRMAHIKEVISGHGRVCLRVRGYSMWPFLRDGDVVMLEKMELDGIAVGDIVMTTVMGGVYCHRVYSRTAGGIRTKGDSLRSFDPAARQNDIVGKVTALKRNGRWVRTGTLLARIKGAVISRAARIYLPVLDVLRNVKKAFSRK